MNRKNKSAYTAIGLLLISNVVIAEDEAVTADTETESIEQEDSVSHDLPEIQVTGELLTRTMKESGLSATVFDHEELEKRQEIRTVRDVYNEIPNVVDMTGTGTAPVIRGIAGNGAADNVYGFFGSTTARLNWQLDGRTASYNEIAFSNIGIWDMERIEFLRGPSSTMTGRNAIAGTMRVETMDPEFEQKFAGRGEMGDLDQERGSVMFNQPITDTIAFRVAADKWARDSAVHMGHYSEEGDPGEYNSESFRTKLLWEPKNEAQTRVLFTINHNEFEGPQSEQVVTPFRKNHSAYYNSQPVHHVDTDSYIFDFSTYLTDAMKLELVASTTNMKMDRTTASAQSDADVDRDEFEVEPRLRYTLDSGDEWVVGSRWYRATQHDSLDFNGFNQVYRDKTDGLAFYVEGVTSFWDHWEITTGLRYEHEWKRRNGGSDSAFNFEVDSDRHYDEFLPKFGLAYHTDDDDVYGILLSRGYNAGGTNVTFEFPPYNYSFDEETVNTIELYGRQDWYVWGGKISTTQNLFLSIYHDYQQAIDYTPDVSTDESWGIVNLDRVRTLGAELGIDWEINRNWRVYSNVSLLNTRVTRAGDHTVNGVDMQDVDGNELPSSPSVMMNSGIAWTSGPWNLHVSGRITDDYYSLIGNEKNSKTHNYAVFDASASYQITKNFKLYAAGRNLLDDHSPILRYPNGNAVLTQSRKITAGLQFNYD